MENQEDIETIESIVDKHGLDATLIMLAEVCWLKAQHLYANWQDHQAAKIWEREGDLINQTASKLQNP